MGPTVPIASVASQVFVTMTTAVCNLQGSRVLGFRGLGFRGLGASGIGYI